MLQIVIVILPIILLVHKGSKDYQLNRYATSVFSLPLAISFL